MAEQDPAQLAQQPPATDPVTPPAPVPAPGQPPARQQEQTVPYTRFKEVNDQLAGLKQQLTALTGEKEQQASAQQTLEQRLAALEKERSEQAAENLRLKVSAEKKLPAELADRLRGATAEELAADADRLLALIKPGGGPGVPPPGGGSTPAKLDLSKMTAAEIRKARAEGKI